MSTQEPAREVSPALVVGGGGTGGGKGTVGFFLLYVNYSYLRARLSDRAVKLLQSSWDGEMVLALPPGQGNRREDTMCPRLCPNRTRRNRQQSRLQSWILTPRSRPSRRISQGGQRIPHAGHQTHAIAHSLRLGGW